MTQTPESATASQDSDRSQSAGTPTEVVSNGSLELQAALVKSLIPAGCFMSDDHRYWFNGVGPFPSVTTVLEVMDKPALTTWKAQQAALAMLHLTQQGWPDTFQPKSEAEAVQYALNEVRKHRTNAASVGSGVHRLADMVARASESDSKAFHVSDDEKPYVDAFSAFLGRYSASNIISSEKAVWSLNGYAGTYDLLMRIDGQIWLLDIKTGKNLYPEFALQLAAYRWADSIILPGNPVAYQMPEVDRTGVLHLRPDQYPEHGYRLWEYPTTYTSDYMTFLGLLEAWKWRKEQVKPISHKD